MSFPQLSGLLGSGRDVAEPIVIAPDGQHVLFTADRDVNDAFEIFSVPIDGSAAPLKLTPGGGRDAFSARFSADASTVAFVAYLPSTNVSELYAAPLGVVPAAALVTLAPGNGFGYFELTPDGSRMVYMAGRVQQRFDLFGVPSDGSMPPVRLNLPAGGDRDVELTPRPRLSPDGSRVVFIGDPVFSNHDELFSAPIDGSAPGQRADVSRQIELEAAKEPLRRRDPCTNAALHYTESELDSPLTAGGVPEAGANPRVLAPSSRLPQVVQNHSIDRIRSRGQTAKCRASNSLGVDRLTRMRLRMRSRLTHQSRPAPARMANPFDQRRAGKARMDAIRSPIGRVTSQPRATSKAEPLTERAAPFTSDWKPRTSSRPETACAWSSR